MSTEQSAVFDPVLLQVDVDTNGDSGHDDKDDDNNTLHVVGPKRGFETTVGRVDGRRKRDDKRTDGGVYTA